MLGGIDCHKHINAHALSKKWNEKILCSAEQRGKDSLSHLPAAYNETLVSPPHSLLNPNMLTTHPLDFSLCLC